MAPNFAEGMTSGFPPPQVSVIIPIYNGAADLPALGHCLLQQTYRTDRVEYLLVDNNSQDETAERLQQLSQQATQRGIQLRSLSETQIQSSYAARNRGILAARGEVLAFTDADCRPQADWLEKLVAPFHTSQVGLVIGEIKALPGDRWLERYAETRETLSQKFTVAHPFYPYGQTANLAVRRCALAASGLFRPYLTTGGDADLCWRVQQSGDWQLVFAAEAVVRHRHRATLTELRKQWRRYGRSNRYLHELHGVPLQWDLNNREVAYRLARWALKVLPQAAWRSLRGRGPAVEMIGIPLDLMCAKARAAGQRSAQLSAAARQIAWLPESVTSEALSESGTESSPDA